MGFCSLCKYYRTWQKERGYLDLDKVEDICLRDNIDLSKGVYGHINCGFFELPDKWIKGRD